MFTCFVKVGIKEPVPTFSACFGAAFLPLHPTVYAEMMADKMKKHNTNAWLINTGWTGGKYGTGKVYLILKLNKKKLFYFKENGSENY